MSPLAPRKDGPGLSTESGIGVGVALAAVLALLIGGGCYAWRFRGRRRRRARQAQAQAEKTGPGSPEGDAVQQHELDSRPRVDAELHANRGAGNTAEMSAATGAVAEMEGRGVVAELDHDDTRGGMGKTGLVVDSIVSPSPPRSGSDEKTLRVLPVYEVGLPVARSEEEARTQGPQELAAYPFQRDEEVVYGPAACQTPTDGDGEEGQGDISPQSSTLPRYQSVRSYGRNAVALPSSPSSPESVTHEQLRYYAETGHGAQDARGVGDHSQHQHQQFLGHVPSSAEELADSSNGASQVSRAAEQDPVWQPEPSAAELNQLLEEQRELERRKAVQLREIELRQAELRERIAAVARAARSPGGPGGGRDG
jgi:hypothetical protein